MTNPSGDGENFYWDPRADENTLYPKVELKAVRSRAGSLKGFKTLDGNSFVTYSDESGDISLNFGSYKFISVEDYTPEPIVVLDYDWNDNDYYYYDGYYNYYEYQGYYYTNEGDQDQYTYYYYNSGSNDDYT